MTNDNTPVPGPGSPPAVLDPPKTSNPELPNPVKDVSEGGFVEQLVKKSQYSLDQNVMALRCELINGLKAIRQAMALPKNYLSRYSDFEKEDVPRMAVAYQTEQYRADAVLRYSLSARWKVELKEGDLFENALQKYQLKVDEYDQILADLIPDDLRSEGHALAAEARFNDGSNSTAADDWQVYRARLQQVRGQPLLGLSTGLPSLDHATSGLHGLVFLGGGPGVGKSALALSMALHALRKHPDLAVIIYSLDMAKTVLYDRLLCQEAGVEYSELTADAPTQELQERLDQAELRLRSEVLPRLRIVEHLNLPEGKSLTYAMASDIMLLWKSNDAMNVLVVVDYFQLLPVPNEVAAGVDADSHRVKALQDLLDWSRKQMNPRGFPILAISEIRKGDSGRGEIGVGDLMGSARLGYSADSVLLLEFAKWAVPGPVTPVRLRVAKGRDGAIRTQIDLLFEHTRSSFKEAPPSPTQRQTRMSKKDPAAQKAKQLQTDPFARLED